MNSVLQTVKERIKYSNFEPRFLIRFLSVLKQVNEAVNLHSQDYENLKLVKLNPEENHEGVYYQYKLETKEDFPVIVSIFTIARV